MDVGPVEEEEEVGGTGELVQVYTHGFTVGWLLSCTSPFHAGQGRLPRGRGRGKPCTTSKSFTFPQ